VRLSENDDNYYVFIFNYSNELQCGDIIVGDNINKTLSVSVKPVGTEIITLKKVVD